MRKPAARLAIACDKQYIVYLFYDLTVNSILGFFTWDLKN